MTLTTSSKYNIILNFDDISTAPSKYNIVLNFADKSAGEEQYLGGIGFDSFVSGQTVIRNRNENIQPLGFSNNTYGLPNVRNFHKFAKPNGLAASLYGRPTVVNKDRYVQPAGRDFIVWGKPSVQNGTHYLKPAGLSFALWGKPLVQNGTRYLTPNGLSSFTSGQLKIESLLSYIKAGAYDFYSPGRPRISYKEQVVQTVQQNAYTRYGTTLVAHGVRYIEQNSPQSLSRYGTAWASHSPRYIEPRGIFQQFPSYHRIGGSQTVKMEGFDFLRFGTRIIPESQTIRPEGFSTLFGDAKIYNYVQHVKPKGFLTVGEKLDLRWGQQEIYNSTQYVLPFHTDQDKTTGEWAYKDYWTEQPLAILNRNRTVKTFGTLMQKFGYADVINKARVIYPTGLASPLEVESTKTLVADGIRYIKPGSIEAPYFSNWHNIWLGAQNKKMQGALLTLYGVPHVENTRRIYRFISLGEQTLFGKGMVSHAIRGIRIQEQYSIAPPVIPMPEVKLGVRYIEPGSIDSVRYGWPHLTERFTKISPRWVQIDRVGEPTVRNVTPQLKVWQFESAEYGKAYIGLYTRHIKLEGLNAFTPGRAKIADRVQQVDFRSYGIQPPTITRLHKIENLGAGKLLPHVIYPGSITTQNFETSPSRYHKVHQNVIRPKSEGTMTLFGNTRIHANTIRVEPGYWEILMGTPMVEHKNRMIFMDSSNCDFFSIGKPRMSPHTIWAVREAPRKAIENHVKPNRILHYVDGMTEGGLIKEPGIEVGVPRIAHKNRRVNTSGYFAFGIGRPSIYNVVNKIAPKGWSSLRLGVLGPIGDQTISFRPKDPMTQWGRPTIQRSIEYNSVLNTTGLSLAVMGRPTVDFFHRSIRPAGINSLAMGTRRAGDNPYMWQGFRVGEHVPTKIGNLNALRFGTAWISYRVREAIVKGDDFAVVGEYEPGKFNLKMSVRNLKQPESPRTQQVIGKGFVAEQFGSSDVKLKLHFIRPYGNSDNFRKGGL